jgi:hypothetical protein
MRYITCTSFLFIASTAFADWPVGAEIDDALMVDITEAGFAEISDSLPVILPPTFALDDIYQEGDIFDEDFTFLGITFAGADLDWYIQVQGLEMGINIINMELSPGNGVLWLDAQVELNVNDAAAPANVEAGGELEYQILWWTETEKLELLDCDLHTEPFVIDFSTSVGLEYLEDGAGGYALDASIGNISWDWDIIGDDIIIDCWLGDILDFLDDIGLDVIDLALTAFKGEINDLVNDLTSDLEPAIEDAMSGLSIEQEIALGEATLDLKIIPNRIDIVPDGMRIGTIGSASAAYNPCIGTPPTEESLGTVSAQPQLAFTPPGVTSPHHFGVYADDDFLNQVLFAAYYGGGLCFTLGPENDTLPLNTALLGILAPGVYDELFPEPKDVIIETRPTSAPVAYAKGDSDINLAVDKFGLDIYADLDYRTAKIVGLDLDVDAGADLIFDNAIGQLDLQVNLSSEDLAATTRHNEFAPGQDEAIASAVSGLFDTVVGPILDGLLGDLSFPIPSIASIGIQSLESAPSGPAEDWFGFYANTGVVTYGSGGGLGCTEDGGIGCEDGGGCDAESGCDAGGSCTSGAIPARVLMVLLSLIGVAIRRRSDSTPA